MRQLKIATQITNRDSQAVEKYLQEISKISMITPEEETTLAQRIKMGDQKALDKLVFEDITPSNRKYPGIIFKQDREVGNEILKVDNLVKSSEGKPIFSKVKFDIQKGDKIAFISRDPIALTTFFEVINGRLKAPSTTKPTPLPSFTS